MGRDLFQQRLLKFSKVKKIHNKKKEIQNLLQLKKKKKI